MNRSEFTGTISRPAHGRYNACAIDQQQLLCGCIGDGDDIGVQKCQIPDEQRVGIGCGWGTDHDQWRRIDGPHGVGARSVCRMGVGCGAGASHQDHAGDVEADHEGKGGELAFHRGSASLG